MGTKVKYVVFFTVAMLLMGCATVVNENAYHSTLNNANVVGTPGSGFGPSGEGYFRLTAFGTYENTVEALKRIKEL